MSILMGMICKNEKWGGIVPLTNYFDLLANFASISNTDVFIWGQQIFNSSWKNEASHSLFA